MVGIRARAGKWKIRMGYLVVSESKEVLTNRRAQRHVHQPERAPSGERWNHLNKINRNINPIIVVIITQGKNMDILESALI